MAFAHDKKSDEFKGDPFIEFMAELTAHARKHYNIDMTIKISDLLDKNPTRSLNWPSVLAIIDSIVSKGKPSRILLIKDAQSLLENFVARQKSSSPSSAREEIAQLFITHILSEEHIDALLEAKKFDLKNFVTLTDDKNRNILHILAQEKYQSISEKGLSTLLNNLEPGLLKILFTTPDAEGNTPLDYGVDGSAKKMKIILDNYKRIPVSDALHLRFSSFLTETDKPASEIENPAEGKKHSGP